MSNGPNEDNDEDSGMMANFRKTTELFFSFPLCFFLYILDKTHLYFF